MKTSNILSFFSIIVLIYSYSTNKLNIYYDNNNNPLKIKFTVKTIKGITTIKEEIKYTKSKMTTFIRPRSRIFMFSSERIGIIQIFNKNDIRINYIDLFNEDNYIPYRGKVINIYLDKIGEIKTFKIEE